MQKPGRWNPQRGNTDPKYRTFWDGLIFGTLFDRDAFDFVGRRVPDAVFGSGWTWEPRTFGEGLHADASHTRIL